MQLDQRIAAVRREAQLDVASALSAWETSSADLERLALLTGAVWGIYDTLQAALRPSGQEPIAQPLAHRLVDVWGRLTACESALLRQAKGQVSGEAGFDAAQQGALLSTLEQCTAELLALAWQSPAYERVAHATTVVQPRAEELKRASVGGAVERYLAEL